MKIDDFTLLYTLAKQGTVRAAAETLFISQPAVSQRLQQIERDWGHQLFLRTPRRLIPTPIGEEVLAFTQDYLRQEQLLKEKILQLKGEISGTLSLGVSSVIGQYILPSLLNQYMKNYPLVKINLMTGVSDEIAQGQYHVRITRGQSSNNKQAIKLFDDPLYLVADKRMAKSKPFIEHQADQNYQTLIQTWRREYFTTPPQIVAVDQIETCKQMVVHGVGRSVLPKTVIRDLNADDFEITPLFIADQPFVRPTWLITESGALALPQVAAFVEMALTDLIHH